MKRSADWLWAVMRRRDVAGRTIWIPGEGEVVTVRLAAQARIFQVQHPRSASLAVIHRDPPRSM